MEKGFVGSAAALAFKTKNWEAEARATNFSLALCLSHLPIALVSANAVDLVHERDRESH